MSLEDNMAAVLRGNHMFLSWKYYIQGIVSAQYTSMHGYTPVHLSKTEYFNYVGYGWGVRQVFQKKNWLSNINGRDSYYLWS